MFYLQIRVWQTSFLFAQVLRSAVDESNVHEVAKKFKLNTFDEFLEERRRQYGDDAGDDDAGVELPS